MVTCPRCGANIDPSALACPYCNTQTHYGRQQAEHQAAYRYQAAQASHQQQAAERQSRQQAIAKKAQHSLYWALAGTLTCCFPAAIVGLVMGLNVKSAAKREGAIAPGTSTAAVVIGCFSIALLCLGIVLYINDSRAREARVALLHAQTDEPRSRETIDQPLACALTELELLEQGHDGKSGIMIQGFRCDGKLEPGADRAMLKDVRFATGSSPEDRYVATACLTRGARWSVSQVRSDGLCSAPSASPSGSARGH
jgi:hypothetical protein